MNGDFARYKTINRRSNRGIRCLVFIQGESKLPQPVNNLGDVYPLFSGASKHRPHSISEPTKVEEGFQLWLRKRFFVFVRRTQFLPRGNFSALLCNINLNPLFQMQKSTQLVDSGLQFVSHVCHDSRMLNVFQFVKTKCIL